MKSARKYPYKEIARMTIAKIACRTCRMCATLALLALPLVAASIASAAHADTIVLSRLTARVSLRDLDLSTTEGQAIARERVRARARILCSRLGDTLDLEDVNHAAHFEQCVARATDQAVQQAISAGLAQTSATAPATAAADRASAGEARRARLSPGDSDLSTREGLKTAHERVCDAARQLCAQGDDGLPR
jgi:UrcA family protein